MIAWYILTFCRVVTGLVFGLSSISKARDLAQFKQAILGFRLLPPRWSSLAALLLLSGECAVVFLVAIGGPLLLSGFVLAALLLCLFCLALASVLLRNMHLPCNCFGASDKPVTSTDLWRNAGFILCAVGGCGAQSWSSQTQPPGLMEWLLVGCVATIFVLLWTQLGNLVRLFR